MQVKVTFTKGDIAEQAADAIVNPTDTDLTMTGSVAAAILRKGGERIREECERLAPIRLGAARVTIGGTLRAYYVIHAAVIRPGERATADSIRQAAREALLRAEEKAIRSIAFPALGTGKAGFPVAEAAEIVLKVVLDHIKMSTILETVRFVLYDDSALKTFEETYQRLSTRPAIRTR
jgi:O-acetyl-ADP-ribose deacetylase (regulator of RNase III)